MTQIENSTIDNTFPIHYRYVDHMHEDGIHLVLQKMYPIRETPCFYMCIDEWQYSMYKPGNLQYCNRVKRISKDGLRRYAYPTKELALASYIKRKTSQNCHATKALERSELALKFAKSLKEPPKCDSSINMGKCNFYEMIVFD